MKEVKHTPTPWITDGEKYIDVVDIYGADGFTVATVEGILVHKKGGSIKDADAFDRPDNENVANAEFIVGACNNHDALTEKADFLQTRLTAITEWLVQNQDDVFRRGLWDAVAVAEEERERARGSR